MKKIKLTEYIKSKKAIITVDDFGISKGVNAAALLMLRKGQINNISVLANAVNLKNIINEAKTAKDNVQTGLHFNLTFGKSLSARGKTILTDENGFFDKNFIQILLYSVFRKKELSLFVGRELSIQIRKLEECSKISHVDGHQHIHVIPLIWNVLSKNKIAKEPIYIRTINEHVNFGNIFIDGFQLVNLFKLILLRFISYFNKKPKINNIYFVSILHTCKISQLVLRKYNIPKGYTMIELMIHPGDSTIDQNNFSQERRHLISKWRNVESNLFDFWL